MHKQEIKNGRQNNKYLYYSITHKGFIHPTEPILYLTLQPIYKIYKWLHNCLLFQLTDMIYKVYVEIYPKLRTIELTKFLENMQETLKETE